MALTSTKMGLRIWNLLSDLYDHTQLADNFAKIDFHDHSPGRGVLIPTEGLADAAVTAAKLATGIDPSGAYSSYRVVDSGMGTIGAAVAAGTYALTSLNPAATAITAAAADPGVFYLDPADHAAPSRTPNYRVHTSLLVTTATAPAVNFTVGLYPVTAIAAGVLTVGAPVSQVVYTTPAANSANSGVGLDVTLTAGMYALGVLTSGSTAASSAVQIRAKLQVHQV